MKTSTPLLLSAVALLLLASCGFDPDLYPDQGGFLLQNASMEQGLELPLAWQYSEGDSLAQQQGLWATEAYDGNRSLKLSRNEIQPRHLSWGQTLIRPAIERRRPVRLRAWVRAENLAGTGAALFIRGDDWIQPRRLPEIMGTTQGVIDLIGTTDWQEVSLLLPEGFPDDMLSVSAYVALLPGAMGTLYVDQVSLTYE